jgi:hypothetical protein
MPTFAELDAGLPSRHRGLCQRAPRVREISRLGHEVRLVPLSYVKPYVKHGNDRADAEAICGAVQRPTMRIVSIKSEEQQALLVLHRVSETLVGERIRLINTIRGHMAEVGIVAAQGASQFPAVDHRARRAGRHLHCSTRPGRPAPSTSYAIPSAGSPSSTIGSRSRLTRTKPQSA